MRICTVGALGAKRNTRRKVWKLESDDLGHSLFRPRHMEILTARKICQKRSSGPNQGATTALKGSRTVAREAIHRLYPGMRRISPDVVPGFGIEYVPTACAIRSGSPSENRA